MAIFKAIGLGILLLVLGALAPDVLLEGKSAVISFLRVARLSADTGGHIVAGAGSSLPTHLPSALPPFPLPSATPLSTN